MLSCGTPETYAGSVKVTVTLTTSPALSLWFRMPVAEVIATDKTVGAVLSTRNAGSSATAV